TVLKETGGKGIILNPSINDLVNDVQNSTLMSDFISGTPLNCLTPVYKEMHKHGIVVSMDGHGADEYLYGYQSSVLEALVNAYVEGNLDDAIQFEETLKNMSAAVAKEVIASAKERAMFLRSMRKGVVHGLKRSLKSVMPVSSQNFYFPSFQTNVFFKNERINGRSISPLFDEGMTHGNMGEKQLLDEFHYTDLPYNLRDFDRGAMQHQMEIRMPFMDYRLVTFCMALPQKSKLNNGYTKYILREALKGIVPESIRTRKLKIGLSAPLVDWFNGPLNEFLLDTCHNAKLNSFEFLDHAKIKEEVAQRCKARSWDNTSAQRIWSVVNLLLLSEN
ncbi:MAG: hypothetical protein KDC84_15815, partial [Crocinitomicaceae bacterium]|nr:hypothetical protein [Crocinitomicaceae bacterium]